MATAGATGAPSVSGGANIEGAWAIIAIAPASGGSIVPIAFRHLMNMKK